MKVFVLFQPDGKTFFKVFKSIDSIRKYFNPEQVEVIYYNQKDETVDITVRDQYTNEIEYVGYDVWLA